MNTTADKKIFTVEEANKTLPLVKAIVSDIVQLFNDVHERRNRLNRIRQKPGKTERAEDNPYEEEVLQIQKELETDIDRLDSFVDELLQLGIELKDPAKGLVDFFTIRDGKEAYLCWQLGEEEIAYWHDLESGFSGRQPLHESSVEDE